MTTLTLRGVPVYCSAVAGHFVAASHCGVRLLHTVAGKWRVSTVGLYYPANSPEHPQLIGVGRYGESLVFAVAGCTEDEPEGEPVDWADPVAMVGYATCDARRMEQGHLAVLDAVCAVVALGADTPETIAAAVGALP